PAFGTILAGEATDAQIAAFAVLLRAKGEAPVEIATLIRTMLEVATPVAVAILAPFAAIVLVLDRAGVDVERLGALLFLVAVGAFVVAGLVAGHRATGAPFSNGFAAGVGAALLWTVVWACIWVLRKAVGTSASVNAGGGIVLQFATMLLIAGGCGLLGGAIGARLHPRDGE
ncbi:MAG: hypothetical protein ACKOOG_03100, partial [Actinomycetota bacterium]